MKKAPPERQRRITLQSNLAIWPHVNFEDSYRFGTLFGLLEEGFFICLGSLFDMASQGGPRVPKRYPWR